MASERGGTREAVAVMESVSALEAAVRELLEAGFTKSDLSMLASQTAVEHKLGHRYKRVEELEDDPSAPRTAYVSLDTMEDRERMVMSSLTTLPALLAAGTVVASAGAVAAVIAGTAAAGALIGTAFANWMDKRHAHWLTEQLEAGGLLLWVRTATPEKESAAVRILGHHAAHDIHLHDVPPAPS